ncbi:deoxyguanosinetriphosphate triphosphohydrolase, partial [Patescibacteria group bacterium]|nr:deoxyguanosinetriphosphate triphosphohydrolase [Patescibacteria group bacterium]
HPPFGHGGEDALNRMMEGHGGFEHNKQSRLVVEKLEIVYPDFEGLNLSLEVLDGLIKHQTAFDQGGKKLGTSSLEAQIVNVADEIAYINHDLDDGLRGGLIHLGELDGYELWGLARRSVEKRYGEGLDEDILVARTISSIMSMMVCDLVENSGEGEVRFSDEMKEMVADLRKFLYDNFYMNPQILEDVMEGQRMIEELFEYYLGLGWDHEEVKNYIAGMTDSFLLKEYKTHII